MSFFKYILSIIIFLSSTYLYAQSVDPILIRIDDTNITKSDFEYAYKKDQSNSINRRQTVNEFIESYINFKLNVIEALKKGYDKDLSFIKEYSSYMEQLEAPYLLDSISPEKIAENIYDRLKENIEISQIFINLPKGNLLPRDTIGSFEKALKAYQSAKEKKGLDFEKVVAEFSEDSISTSSIIPGYIGWRTAAVLPLQIEDAMYNTSPGNVSFPVRTNSGYYVVKVHNKRPDIGQALIAHIVLTYPLNPTQHEIDSVTNLANRIYNDLLSGGDFNKLCGEYSMDSKTVQEGGLLGWYSVNRPLNPSIASIIFGTDETEKIFSPYKTAYGYHIFKLIDKLPLTPWGLLKDKIVETIEKGDRKDLLVDEKIKLLSQKYEHGVNNLTYKELLKNANNFSLRDSIFFKQITAIENQILVSTEIRDFNVKDFISFIEKNPLTEYNVSTDILFYKFKEFVLHCLTDVKRNDMFVKHPEFRLLSEEFHDGILYFNIMNKEVWEKAQSDLGTIERLFDENRSKYTWEASKFKGYVIHTKKKEQMKIVKDVIKKNKESNDLRKVLTTSLDPALMDDVIIEKGLWGKNENPYVDQKIFKLPNNNRIVGYPECMVEGRLISSPESFDDAFGLIVADYQKALEKERFDNLRQKYRITIDQNVLNDIE